jgi:hypothetical protein
MEGTTHARVAKHNDLPTISPETFDYPITQRLSDLKHVSPVSPPTATREGALPQTLRSGPAITLPRPTASGAFETGPDSRGRPVAFVCGAQCSLRAATSTLWTAGLPRGRTAVAVDANFSRRSSYHLARVGMTGRGRGKLRDRQSHIVERPPSTR